MKRVMITGITGYIGSHLAQELIAQGIEVFGLAREPWNTTYIADIEDELHLFPYDGTCESICKALQLAEPEVVFHLATYYAKSHSSDEITAMHECNLLYGNYLLEAMKECGVHSIVFASTVFCHYRQEMYNPLNLYAATKQAFSDLMRYYTEACGIRSLTIFLSDSYGPGDKRPKILNLLKTAYHTGRTMDLSDGSQDYDVLHISDIVSALIHSGNLVLKQLEPNVSYQIFRTDIKSLREAIGILEQNEKIVLPANWGAFPASPRSINNAVRVFPCLPGWNARVSLEDGLREFWNFKQ